MWFQLLVGDVSRELPHGWAKELTVRYGVPAEHVALIERCVGWMDERPKDAGELLPLLRIAAGSPGTAVEPPPLAAVQAAAAPTVTGAGQVTPSPVSDGRRRGLVAALARLTHAYDELNDMAKWTFANTAAWGLMISVPVAVVPVVLDGPRVSWATYAGIILAPVVWAVYVYLMRSGVKAVAEDLQKKAEAIVEEVAADFTAEVAGWGGRASLRHAPTVRRLRAELDPPPPVAPGPSADDVTADPTKKALLLGRLAELRAVRKDAKEAKDASWVGVSFFWLIAVPAVGGSVFALFSESFRFSGGPAGICGAMTGLIVFAIGWWGAAAIRRNQDRKWAGACDRFAADYPRLVASWGGRHVLESPETMAAVTRVLDPAAGAARPGLIGRLFGG
jgi:hypothetical protein